MPKIFIEKLPRNCTSKILREYFAELAPKFNVRRSKNKGKKTKMHAVIEIFSESVFEKILSMEHEINGKKLKLKPYSKSKPRKRNKKKKESKSSGMKTRCEEHKQTLNAVKVVKNLEQVEFEGNSGKAREIQKISGYEKNELIIEKRKKNLEFKNFCLFSSLQPKIQSLEKIEPFLFSKKKNFNFPKKNFFLNENKNQFEAHLKTRKMNSETHFSGSTLSSIVNQSQKICQTRHIVENIRLNPKRF